MTSARSTRPTPVQSLHYEDAASSEAARDLVFLDELDRQAEIATHNITDAIERGLHVEHVRDRQTWSLLQGALFAAMIVARILKPRDVRSYPGLSDKESREYAERRGKRLRSLLEIDKNSALFKVEIVRNSFEHFDHRLEERFIAGAQSLSDWYITDGTAFMTPERPNGPTSVGLRVFFPAGGELYFDRERLDLFALDIALLDLRQQVLTARQRLKAQLRGRGLFVGHPYHLMTAEAVRSRREQWLRLRAEAGTVLT
jgi:hypothetical protein